MTATPPLSDEAQDLLEELRNISSDHRDLLHLTAQLIDHPVNVPLSIATELHTHLHRQLATWTSPPVPLRLHRHAFCHN
jgi:hypothetical protein